jgi:hypothetical protein
VSITVKNVATRVEFGATSNAGGEYVASNLIQGEYTVTAAKQGFTTLARSEVVLHVYDQRAVELTVQRAWSARPWKSPRRHLFSKADLCQW